MGLTIQNSPDATNNPSLIVINGITLPNNTVIYINGKKVFVQDKILDGVSVTERISREPYEIEFEGVLLIKNSDGSLNYDLTQYIFPQKALEQIWQKIWLPDTVQKIQNTYLNGLGVQQIIIESITPTTLRGSKDLPFRIKAIENVVGQTLIIS